MQDGARFKVGLSLVLGMIKIGFRFEQGLRKG